MEKKRTHTIEEIDELKAWFDARESQLPASIQIDTSTFTPDLPKTINMLLEQAYICYNNPKMQGAIWLLVKIKEKLENIGKE